MRDRVPAMRHGQVETSWDGDITIWSEKDHKSSLQGPKGDQRETTRRTWGRTRGDRRGTSMESSNGEHGVFKRRAWSLQMESMESSNGEHGGDTAWEQASPAAPTSTTSSSRAGPRRPTTTQRMGSSGSRQTDREWVVGQVDWYDKKPSLPRVYYVLTYRWQNTFSSCNRITKLNFYTILRQIYSLKSKDKLFWYVVRTCYVSERKLNSKNSGWFFSKNLFLKCISKQ
jgi:hypothetical protein